MASNNNNATNNNDNNNNNNNNNTNNESKTQSSEDKTKDLRKQILAINADTTLSAREKAMKIQGLMAPNVKAFAPQVPQPPPPEQELAATYKDEAKKLYGCKHYFRSCKLKAACCGHLFTCRFCHDEGSDHQINRFHTQEVMCMECKTIQPVSPNCAKCDKVFARYYCGLCKFFDDDSEKSIFHCPHCGICRAGKSENFKHCMICKACLAAKGFETHKCIENLFDSNCPICSQNMFNSVQTITVMHCGHGIHQKCLSEWTRKNFKCPLCAKSIWSPEDMKLTWEQIDNIILSEPMFAEFRGRVAHILCNDCGDKTWVPMHFRANKCGKCDSYATSIITQKTIDPKDPVTLSTNHKVRYTDDPEVMQEIQEALAQAAANVGGEGDGEDSDSEGEEDSDEDEGDDEGEAEDSHEEEAAPQNTQTQGGENP